MAKSPEEIHLTLSRKLLKRKLDKRNPNRRVFGSSRSPRLSLRSKR